MAANPLKIDLETYKGYAGLGDIVMLAWLAEGCRRAGQSLVFHRKRDLELMDLFGLTADPEPGGVSLDEAYRTELADRGRRPRLDYVRDLLNVTGPPARPTLRIAADRRAWAADRVRELGGPPVILFPQTAWVAREWPASYWVDLAWKLKAAGVPVLLLMAPKDERFTNTPVYWWGTPIDRLAALIEQAALVVGNDSFPAHLAGAIGTPTLALMGPTRPTVFAHAPAVECLGSDAIDCTGCHFGPPFRAACDQGCQSLFRLDPDLVLRRVLQKLRQPNDISRG
ncbi:MAG TPA: glycosyltransferase family 9 protein [Gemmataceae bacterium]|nr:glycosyltransferase family 9 protein [Gemmataceae bacterium]